MFCPIEQDKRWIKLLSFLKDRDKAIYYWNVYEENVPDYFYDSLPIQDTSNTEVQSDPLSISIKPGVEEFKGFWNRQQVASQTDKVFLFGDNTNDRTVTKYIPSSTQAVIRGLPNAIGIDTKKDRGTSVNSYLTDSDFNWFKNHVDNQIQLAKNSGKTIVIPADGIGTGKAMLKEKAPKLFEYLQQELNKLKANSSNTGEKTLTIKEGVPEIFESNPELANQVYSKILANSGISGENLLSLLLKDNIIEKKCS